MIEGQPDLQQLEAAARAAGASAMAFFRDGERTTAKVSYKAGNSPVSEADIAANDTLERLLRRARPDAGWISEETAAEDHRRGGDSLFIVDPIDGTRAFIAGDPQWSVSVALVRQGHPVAAVVHAPALGQTFSAAQGGGAFRNGVRIACSRRGDLAGAHIAGPRQMLERLEAASGAGFIRASRIPSLALRLVRAADATLDAALASEGAHDWDIAAADLILSEAGGVLIGADGRSLTYGGPNLRRGPLAAGAPALAQAIAGLTGLL